jgi:hypothetical protein
VIAGLVDADDAGFDAGLWATDHRADCETALAE